MAVKPSTLTPLDAHVNTNWDINAAPVAVFNHETSLHDRLAYCWGLASRLSDITHMLGVHRDTELHHIAMLLECNASPLLAVLNILAEESAPGRVKP